MKGVDKQFLTFGNISPLPEESTCKTVTIYAAPIGVMLPHKAPIVTTFDAQGAAIANKILHNTSINNKKSYSPMGS